MSCNQTNCCQPGSPQCSLKPKPKPKPKPLAEVSKVELYVVHLLGANGQTIHSLEFAAPPTGETLSNALIQYYKQGAVRAVVETQYTLGFTVYGSGGKAVYLLH